MKSTEKAVNISNNNAGIFHLDISKNKYCIKNNYSGITYQDNIYQVRIGSYLTYYENIDLYTWVYM